MPRAAPLITANQVTLARLIPMPLLSWLIYRGYQQGEIHGNPYLWSALIAGTLIGCTDWVDGLLARKYGPTVLGGLLDPIADKVFIAFAYVPFADDKMMIPAWVVALMFTRELFITSLRSAYEQRNLTLKTSYLAKVKTWTQMQGIGVILLFPLVENRSLLTWVLVALTGAPLVVMALFWVVKRKFWRGALVMSGSVAPILTLYVFAGTELTIRWIMFAVVAITWVSGLDYIAVGWKQLRGRGDFAKADAVRLIGALALPALLFTVLVRMPGATWSWPIFVILSLELAVGGLDNLMSHHKRAANALAWGGRVLGVCALLGLALALPGHAPVFLIAAVCASLIGVAAEFWRGRDYFLDKRIRDRALREVAVHPPEPQLK